jgi:hypothetical protein
MIFRHRHLPPPLFRLLELYCWVKRNAKSLARIFHESLAATTDMGVLPGVLGCRPLRRTVQVRLGSNPAVRGTVAR